MNEMQLYYVVDRINNKENLIVLPDDILSEEMDDYISFMTSKTGIDLKEKSYPVGTVLSACMHLVPAMIGFLRHNKIRAYNLCSEIFERDYSHFPYQNVERCMLTEHFFKNQHFPFNREMLYFLTYFIVGKLLFSNNNPYKDIPQYSDIDNKIENSINFVKVCAAESAYCSIDTLYKVSNIIGLQLTNCKKVHVPENKKYNKLQLCNQLEKVAKKLEYLSKTCYQINNVEDLFFSSLQEIFDNRYLIKLCQHCNGYFVAKSTRQKYCENPSPENLNRTCRLQVKHEQKLSGDISKASRRTYKSIYTMLLNRQAGIHLSKREQNRREKDLNNFKLQAENQRKLVMKEKITEQDYVNWMKSYWEKIKSDTKERKKKAQQKR